MVFNQVSRIRVFIVKVFASIALLSAVYWPDYDSFQQIPLMPRSTRVLFAAAISLYSAFSMAAADSPYLFVLGVAQDAGYPQAGCYQQHCMPGWESPTLRRTPTALALIDPGPQRHYLFEATPQLPEQLYTLQLEAPASRNALDGIFLTHAHIGHYAGLMFLGREAMGASAVPVYAMPRMGAFLQANGPWSQLLELGNIVLKPLQDQQAVILEQIKVTPLLVPHRDEYSETVGYRIQGPDRSALFIPDINKWADWESDITELVRSVDYALLDATFFADGELGDRDMSQIPHPFVAETMELFAELAPAERARIWFIHFNHTNPLLDSGSAESRAVIEAGFNIAREGVRLPL